VDECKPLVSGTKFCVEHGPRCEWRGGDPEVGCKKCALGGSRFCAEHSWAGAMSKVKAMFLPPYAQPAPPQPPSPMTLKLPVGRYSLTLSKHTLKAPGTKRLKLNYGCNAFKLCFQIQLAPPHPGRRPAHPTTRGL